MGTGPTTLRRIRWSVVAMIALTALVGPGCTGDDETAEAPDGERSDEQVIALTILQVGDAEATLEPALLREHLVLLFQVNGRLARSDAECATDAFLDRFTAGEPLSPLALSEVLSADTRGDRRDAVDGCVPPATGPETPSDPFETTVPEPPPEDLDPVALRAHLVELTATVARSLGMDRDEADCFGAEAYGGLDDRQVVATLDPEAVPDVELPERTGTDEVQACLTAERIEELGAELRPVLSAHVAAAGEATEPATGPPSVMPGD